MSITRKLIGSFINESGMFVVSDPDYDIDDCRKCSGNDVLENIKQGMWNAEVEIVDKGKRDIHVALLIATHERYKEDSEGSFTKRNAEFELRTDGGIAGIFDAKFYQDDSVFGNSKPECDLWLDDPDDVWYCFCVDAITTEEQADVIPFGVVSASGNGECLYYYTYTTDSEGYVVKVVLTFIFDEDCDDGGCAEDLAYLLIGKQEHCERCHESGIRYDAMLRGFSASYFMGEASSDYCEGCYYHDPLEFNRVISANFSKKV
jgi:hypothetical protein